MGLDITMVMLARESQRCLIMITRLQQVLPLFACSPPANAISLQRALAFICAHTYSTLDKMSSSSDVSTLMSMFSNLGRHEIEQEYRCHPPTAPCDLSHLVPGHRDAISKRPSSSSPNLATWSVTPVAARVMHPYFSRFFQGFTEISKKDGKVQPRSDDGGDSSPVKRSPLKSAGQSRA
jgi:hypothetical protein